jgi:hypothetical protein
VVVVVHEQVVLVVPVAAVVTEVLAPLVQVTPLQQAPHKVIVEQVTAVAAVVLVEPVLPAVVGAAVLVQRLQLQERVLHGLAVVVAQQQLRRVHLVAQVKLVVVTAVAAVTLLLVRLIQAVAAEPAEALGQNQVKRVVQEL